jgi:hypothetical protein
MRSSSIGNGGGYGGGGQRQLVLGYEEGLTTTGSWLPLQASRTPPKPGMRSTRLWAAVSAAQTDRSDRQHTRRVFEHRRLARDVDGITVHADRGAWGCSARTRPSLRYVCLPAPPDAHSRNSRYTADQHHEASLHCPSILRAHSWLSHAEVPWTVPGRRCTGEDKTPDEDVKLERFLGELTYSAGSLSLRIGTRGGDLDCIILTALNEIVTPREARRGSAPSGPSSGTRPLTSFGASRRWPGGHNTA